MRAPRFAIAATCCTAACAVLIAGPAPPPASAGEFRAVQCPAGSELKTLASSSNVTGLAFQAQCDPPMQRLGIYPPRSTAVSHGDWGQWIISAPGIQLNEISWTPRWDSVHGWQPAFLTESPGGQKHSHPLPPAGIGTPPTRMTANNGPYTAWIQRLSCQEVSCPGLDITWAAVISDHWQATASDHVAPQITAEQSSLHTGGQVMRGEHSVHVSATDVGGGLRRTWIEVNGTLAASEAHACQTGLEDNIALNLSPCPAATEATFTVNTAAAPFLDGTNRIRA